MRVFLTALLAAAAIGVIAWGVLDMFVQEPVAVAFATSGARL